MGGLTCLSFMRKTSEKNPLKFLNFIFLINKLFREAFDLKFIKVNSTKINFYSLGIVKNRKVAADNFLRYRMAHF